MDLSVEDMKEHGRLLLLKQKLVSLVDAEQKLDVKTLGMFQLKDFCHGEIEDPFRSFDKLEEAIEYR